MKFLLCSLLIFTFSQNVTGQTTPPPAVPFNTVRDSTYIAAAAKLKSLFVAHIHSSCNQEARAKSLEYKRKLRLNNVFDTGTLAKDPGGLNWLKDNWQKTGFTSYEQAQNEYSEVMKAQRECLDQNSEYKEYLMTSLQEYGGTIVTEMVMEVVAEYPDKF
jgi:hypothetical protein